ncbi:MAG: efflux RND transporter permease subunit, partial [Cyanobacteria bacterium J06648_11]
GILGLFVTQTAIGATVIVGAVLLVGIVVNNAIIMVELANQIHAQVGCDRVTAMLKAAPQRLRPIAMTTITTVLGMFPLALGMGEGSEFLQPLGVVVFSGLSLATLLTLFIIPSFYSLLHGLVDPKQVPDSRKVTDPKQVTDSTPHTDSQTVTRTQTVTATHTARQDFARVRPSSRDVNPGE